jgi:hypothetical protein
MLTVDAISSSSSLSVIEVRMVLGRILGPTKRTDRKKLVKRCDQTLGHHKTKINLTIAFYLQICHRSECDRRRIRKYDKTKDWNVKRKLEWAETATHIGKGRISQSAGLIFLFCQYFNGQRCVPAKREVLSNFCVCCNSYLAAVIIGIIHIPRRKQVTWPIQAYFRIYLRQWTNSNIDDRCI